jgi:hypothetical protein
VSYPSRSASRGPLSAADVARAQTDGQIYSLRALESRCSQSEFLTELRVMVETDGYKVGLELRRLRDSIANREGREDPNRKAGGV